MAANILPTTAARLIPLGKTILAGTIKVGASVPVTMTSAAEIETHLDGFIGANNAYNSARSARREASGAYQLTTNAIATWLATVRNVLCAKSSATAGPLYGSRPGSPTAARRCLPPSPDASPWWFRWSAS